MAPPGAQLACTSAARRTASWRAAQRATHGPFNTARLPDLPVLRSKPQPCPVRSCWPPCAACCSAGEPSPAPRSRRVPRRRCQVAHRRCNAPLMADLAAARALAAPQAAARRGGIRHPGAPVPGAAATQTFCARSRSAAAQKVTNQCEEDCADDLRPICVSHVNTNCKPSW